MKTESTAVQFFLEHAGYSYDPKTETAEQGREKCAHALARAEAWASEAGLSFAWERDDLNGAEWCCIARDASGGVIGSLCGVDFGEGVEPWGQPYARVVQAEIALEETMNIEEAGADMFPAHPAAVGIDWGADGCYVVNAHNAKGAEILCSVFPGRGRESLDSAVLLARLLAQSAGCKVTGPAGLVEAVEHPGGVSGVLGLDVWVKAPLAYPLGFGEAGDALNDAIKRWADSAHGSAIDKGCAYLEGAGVPLAVIGAMDHYDVVGEVHGRYPGGWTAFLASLHESARAAMGAAASASNAATAHLRVDVAKLLFDCLGFIEGFEDDDTQGEDSCVPGLLERLRAVVPVAPYQEAPAAALPAAVVGISEHQRGSSLIVYGNEKQVFAVDLVHDGESVEKRLASVGTANHPGAVVIPLWQVVNAPSLAALVERVAWSAESFTRMVNDAREMVPSCPSRFGSKEA